MEENTNTEQANTEQVNTEALSHTPLMVLGRIGYTHEVHEKDLDHFVLRSSHEISKANPYYIPVVHLLKVERANDTTIRATFLKGNGILFRTEFFCGYSRAVKVAVKMVISWHKVSSHRAGK